MLNIIFLLLIGSGFAYVSKYNLALVSVDLGFYRLESIPLFYVIVGSIAIGLTMSYFLQLIQNISNYLVLQKKGKEIKAGKEDVLDLTKRVHQLEIENEHLKHSEPETIDSNAL